ncbi:hypothetical protein [Methylobacterium sp. Gmos1]
MPVGQINYRVSVRPDPGNRARYLWTIYGTQSMFWEESPDAFTSVEQALDAANERLAELTR